MKLALRIRVYDEPQAQLGAVKLIDMVAIAAVSFFGVFLIYLFQQTNIPPAIVPATSVPLTSVTAVQPPAEAAVVPVRTAPSPAPPPPTAAEQERSIHALVSVDAPSPAPPPPVFAKQDSLTPQMVYSSSSGRFILAPSATQAETNEKAAERATPLVEISPTETAIEKNPPKIIGTPRLTTVASVKGFWWRSLPRPRQRATADYDKKVKFCDVMEQRLLSGYYDLDAEVIALEWNAREYSRVGDVGNAKPTEIALKDARKQLSDRAELRRLAELKEQELELKKEELTTNQMGFVRMNDMSRALNRIAFQMLIGNVLKADENGMELNYWETGR